MDYKQMMDNVGGAIGTVCADMCERHPNMAITVARAELNDCFVVAFLEEDGSYKVMDTLAEFAKRLYVDTGRHFCISNNSPTDGTCLVFVDPDMDEVFDKERHKKRFIEMYREWETCRIAPKPTLQVLFLTLEDMIFRDQCDPEWEEELAYEVEPWEQVMYWNRNGFERSPK